MCVYSNSDLCLLLCDAVADAAAGGGDALLHQFVITCLVTSMDIENWIFMAESYLHS